MFEIVYRIDRWKKRVLPGICVLWWNFRLGEMRSSELVVFIRVLVSGKNNGPVKQYHLLHQCQK